MNRRTNMGVMVGPTLLRVVSSTEQVDDNDNGQNRWDYQVNFGNWNDETTLATVSDFEAENIWEKSNTSSVVMGITISSLPGSYSLQPCPNETFVMGFFSPISMKWLFQWPNQFDGNC